MIISEFLLNCQIERDFLLSKIPTESNPKRMLAVFGWRCVILPANCLILTYLLAMMGNLIACFRG